MTGEEREFKYVLTREQYKMLHPRVAAGDSEIIFQESLFFDRESSLLDREGALASGKWVLRLRLHARITAEHAPGPDAALYGMVLEPDGAEYALKGPSRLEDGAVVRMEIEAEGNVRGAAAAASRRILEARVLPEAVRGQAAAHGAEGPLTVTAELRNIRVKKIEESETGEIEIALDRSETPDGRKRYELEIECSEESREEASRVAAKLGLAGMQTSDTGKYMFAAGLE